MILFIYYKLVILVNKPLMFFDKKCPFRFQLNASIKATLARLNGWRLHGLGLISQKWHI